MISNDISALSRNNSPAFILQCAIDYIIRKVVVHTYYKHTEVN